jgi:hypothetical protein
MCTTTRSTPPHTTQTLAGGIAKPSTFAAFPQLFMFGMLTAETGCVWPPDAGPLSAACHTRTHMRMRMRVDMRTKHRHCLSVVPGPPAAGLRCGSCWQPTSSCPCPPRTPSVSGWRRGCCEPAGLCMSSVMPLLLTSMHMPFGPTPGLASKHAHAPQRTPHTRAHTVGGILGFALVFGGAKGVVWAERQKDFPFVGGIVPIVISCAGSRLRRVVTCAAAEPVCVCAGSGLFRRAVARTHAHTHL